MRRVTISGRPAISSKPSRRIISISTASCNSPRPSTLKVSGDPVSSTRIDTFVCSSLSSRSRRLRLVTNCPSRPANGELFTENWIAIVGSSITIGGSGDGFSSPVIVSPIVSPLTPATAIMSPVVVSSISVRFKPLKLNSFVIFTACSVPSSLAMFTVSPFFSVPLNTRAIPSRPR